MNRLKELRLEKGFSQSKMQKLTNISQSHYSRIEQNQKYYHSEQCRKIALALNTSADYLLGLTDCKNPSPPSIQKNNKT